MKTYWEKVKERRDSEENELTEGPKKSSQKVGCLSIIGAIVVAIILIQFIPGFVSGFISGFKNGFEHSTDSSYVSASSSLTKEEYKKLHEGMTYDEVCKVLGSRGKQETDTKASGYSYSSYTWGSGMKTVIVTFINDKADTMSEIGLD